MIEINIERVPITEPIRREWVKFQLRACGSSLSTIAREQGLCRNTVATVFTRPYPRMESIIARRLGIKPQEIWPERYDKHGRPNRPKTGRPPKSSSNKITTINKRRNVNASRAI